MKLKTNRDLAKEKVSLLITDGQSLLDRVTDQYFEHKKNGTFQQDVHVRGWKSEYNSWLKSCTITLDEIFPTQRELVKLKNAPISPIMQHGTNIKWGNLTNTIQAKLSTLDEIIDTVDSYSDEYDQLQADSKSKSESKVGIGRNKNKLLAIVIFILGIIIALVTNIASNTLPVEIKAYLWLSWPLLILLTITAIFLVWKQQP